MKNPLNKRFTRELRQDIGKYIALFLFLTLTIGFVSGFLVADNSMKHTYDESFEKYNIEDGHFTLAAEADKGLIKDLENEDIKVYSLFYKDKDLENSHSIRIYKPREDVDKVCLMDGEMPASDDEIVIDRLYAENNDIEIGDTLKVDKKDYKISGTVALSDYSCLFKNNTDMMFDANQFTIAIVTDKAFDDISDSGLHYTYAWTNNKELSDFDAKEKADDIISVLAKTGMVTDFVSRQDNQAINFTGNDMGGGKAMIIWLLYVIIVILAFIFGVTTKNSIEKESLVIGTLRASGYTRGELIRHYLTLPTLVTLVAAVFGNVLGYTCMKFLMAGLYMHSYSLMKYETLWNAEAFLLTTVIPCIIILIINVLILWRTLSLPPLSFLRHDLTRKQKKRVTKLPDWKFLTRFRIRIILQNLPSYITMFVGILFASVLLMFGMVMTPLLSHYKDDVGNSKISEYQYILKTQVDTQNKNAEKYAVESLDIPDAGEDITVYGISENSKYLDDLKLYSDKKEVVATNGYLEKFGLEVGDEIELEKTYEKKTYKFKIVDTYDYTAALAIFMPIDNFSEVFDKDNGYYNGYFSDEKLDDIDDMMIATIITEADLTVIADQLDDSMGTMFYLVWVFSAILYVLIIFLLAKLIIEKNMQSISMVKILGYSNKEAGRLYNTATAIVACVSFLLSIPLSAVVMRGLYYIFMQEINGWLEFYIAPWIYPAMLGIGIFCYYIVHLIQMKKIRKVPLSQALKNVE